MKRYFIQNKDKDFWCEYHGGYWSKFEESLRYRFEGIYLWVVPLLLMMKLLARDLNVKMVRLPSER